MASQPPRSSRQQSSQGSAPAKPGDYFVTGSGNKISRRAGLLGTSSVTLGSKDVIQPDVILRGDLHRTINPAPAARPPTSSASSGAAAGSAVGTGAGTAAPSGSSSAGSRQSSAPQPAQQSQTPTSIIIGKSTILGQGSILHPPFRVSHGQGSYYPIKIGENVFVGPYCQISATSVGSHVHIGAGSILQSFCTIRDNVKILPGTVVPPNTVIPPGVIVGGQPAQIVGDLPDGWGVQSSVVQGPGESGIPVAMAGPAAIVTAIQQAHQQHISAASGSQHHARTQSQTVTIPQTMVTAEAVNLGALVPTTIMAAMADAELAAPDSSVWVEGGDLRGLVRLVK